MTKKNQQDCTLARDAAVEAVRERVAVLEEHIAPCRQEDADGIHDLRVASRRLRAALKAHKAAFPRSLRKALAKRVKKVTRRLGTARELDVCVEVLRMHADVFPGEVNEGVTFVLGVLRRGRAAESASVAQAVAVVDTPEFAQQVEGLVEAAGSTRACYLERLEKDLKNKYAKILDAYSAWQRAPSGDSLHQVRIQCKKFRYACEIAAGQYGKGMDRFTARLKTVQTLLGDWNDARVLRNYVNAAKPEAPPELAGAVDQLYQWLDGEAARLLAAFEKEAGTIFTKEAKRMAESLFEKPEAACCRTEDYRKSRKS